MTPSQPTGPSIHKIPARSGQRRAPHATNVADPTRRNEGGRSGSHALPHCSQPPVGLAFSQNKIPAGRIAMPMSSSATRAAFWRCALAPALAASFSATPASAADYYAGKTIELLVGAPPGGGYDIYARTVARHFGRHIPGNPTIVVKNMPGAGSAKAAQYIQASRRRTAPRSPASCRARSWARCSTTAPRRCSTRPRCATSAPPTAARASAPP